MLDQGRAHDGASKVTIPEFIIIIPLRFFRCSLAPKGGDRNPEAAGLPTTNGTTMAFFGSANLAAGDVPYLLHQFWGVFALVIYLFYR